MTFTRKIIIAPGGRGALPYNGIDLTGKRFGRLLVLERSGTTPGTGSIQWLCKCDCGNEKLINGACLRREDTTESCGCLQDIARKEKALPSGHASRNALYYEYKGHAKRRKLSWELLKEQFFLLTSSNCVYCGSEPYKIKFCASHNGTYTYNGIDRVNNDLGYLLDNSVSCCARCNYAKGDMTKEEFLTWARKVVQYNGN